MFGFWGAHQQFIRWGWAMKLLILDDDPVFTAVLQTALVNVWPGQVRIVTHCAAALEVLAGPHYIPLCVLDLKLPDGDGLDVAQTARERGYLAFTELAVMTASPFRASVLRAKELGVAHFFVKPFLPDNIKAMIAKSLSHFHGDREFLMQLLGFFRKTDISQLTESAVSQYYHLSLLSNAPSVSNALGRIRSYMGHRYTKKHEIEMALNALRLHCEFLLGKHRVADGVKT
jgi:CheY-like chemotaxis protein